MQTQTAQMIRHLPGGDGLGASSPTRSPVVAQRIDCQEVMEREIAISEKNRNKMCARIDWHFTTADARIKLKQLYPSFEM
ncbi:MAG: hypothetical protein AB7K24_16300 [Gemmataceae bacterium]